MQILEEANAYYMRCEIRADAELPPVRCTPRNAGDAKAPRNEAREVRMGSITYTNRYCFYWGGGTFTS